MLSPENQKKLYDAACKDVLAEKGIVSHIMHDCMEEFQSIPPAEIALHCIEETPLIASVPVTGEPFLTRISGLPSESNTPGETPTFYDVFFSAIAPPLDTPIHLLINAEAQNKSHPGYPILKRGTFYACRMISGQYGKVFTHSDYGKIRKVYSLWICTRPARKQEYTINAYSMQEKQLTGNHHANRRHYDLLTVIVINLGRKPANKLTGLFRLLTALFLDRMESSKLKHILEDEYAIRLTPSLEKGVDTMCNLSEGLVEDVLKQGRKQGRKEGRKEGRKQGEESATVKNLKAIMQKMHLTAEEAMDMFDIPATKRPRYAELL